MSELFKVITETGYNYLTFVILIFLLYLVVAALIKVISNEVIKIVLSIKTPTHIQDGEVRFDIKGEK